MKNNFNIIAIIFSISTVLVSCSQSPEDYGKKLAAKSCECDKESVSHHEARAKEFLNDLKSGKYKRMSETTTNFSHIFAYDWTESEATQKCHEEFRKMEEETKVKYAKDEDRKTVYNAFSANKDVCTKENNKTFNDLQKEIQSEMKKLPQ